jgi:sec-independent protein translocase protein TatC
MVSKPVREIAKFNLPPVHMTTHHDSFEDQPLTEHLRELRSCLIYSFVAVFAGFCASYAVIRPIGTWFFKPLTKVLPDGTSLIFTSYQEGFFFI